MGKPSTPKPVVVSTVCSMCGLAWERHGQDPTAETCVGLLKADLAVANGSRWTIVNPTPTVQPWQPWVDPYRIAYGHDTSLSTLAAGI